MGRPFALYYPSASDPQYIYLPSRKPLVTLADGSDLGLLQQRGADGEPTMPVIHPVRRHFLRPFRGLTASDKAARETFFNVTRGLPIIMGDDTLDDFVTVKAIGQSLAGAGAWQAITTEAWERVEEFEESFAVPTLSDAGQVRAGYIEIEDLNVEGTVTFDTPFADDGYYPVITSCVASTGDTFKADIVLPWAAAGFDVSIGGVSPGSGESVRITYIAVHN